MRRTLAILALVATSWPHVVVLECALGSAPPISGESAHHGTMHAGAHQGTAQQWAAGLHIESDEGALGAGTRCAMVMACGLVMIQAEGESGAELAPGGPGTQAFLTLDLPTAADLVADPPPPRRRA